MVERGGLENRCSPCGYRGFESLPLRQGVSINLVSQDIVCAIMINIVIIVKLKREFAFGKIWHHHLQVSNHFAS